MAITDAIVADYVAGRLDGDVARRVQSAVEGDGKLAMQVRIAKGCAQRARSRLRT